MFERGLAEIGGLRVVFRHWQPSISKRILLIMEATRSALAHWANFYVIVGSSAGALTGLQFVVMTLVAQANLAGGIREIRAFGTPNVVHFCAALLISAIMTAPWDTLFHLGLCLSAFGIVGFVYAVIVVRHARKQTSYAVDAWDWFWYVALPLITHAGLATAGILLSWNVRSCLFLIAPTTLVLLFTGIRNAWDTVTYVAVDRLRANERKE
jgi:hypothetical protein